jgi:recombinational DNA repair ATPase RecF
MKINQITLSNFRGIPDELTLNFLDRNNKPTSVLIIGDNGTGKSSIVDAIEFALQARIQRSSKLHIDSVPSVISLYKSKDTFVKIKFDNLQEFTRDIIIVEGKESFDKSPLKGFGFSPIVIRRKDILGFWEIPAFERLKVFFDFLRDLNDSDYSMSPTIEILELKKELITLKRDRDKFSNELSELLDNKKIPTGYLTFRKFLRTNRRLYKIPLEKWANLSIAFGEIERVKKDIKKLNLLNKESSNTPNKNKLNETINEIAQTITHSFKEISSSGDFVKHIYLKAGKKTEIDVSFIVKLFSDKITTPEKIFSEANLDLLALLIFIAFIEKANEIGQEKIIVFDDIFQSIDATFRLRCISYILNKFTNWQIIITTHDRLFQEQVRELFRQKNHNLIELEIKNWKFDKGPIILSSGKNNSEILEEKIDIGEVYEICSQTGILLENICNELSHSLPISVTRRKGDKYTLGDLWPAVHSKLGKIGLKDCSEKVNNLIILRNLVGAHFNEWSRLLSRTEAQEFGNSVITLYVNVFCKNCGNYLQEVKIGTKNISEWSCKCRTLKTQK